MFSWQRDVSKVNDEMIVSLHHLTFVFTLLKAKKV